MWLLLGVGETWSRDIAYLIDATDAAALNNGNPVHNEATATTRDPSNNW